MPYYLASYIGAGTHTNPCRPSVTDPGWSAIDLRPDGGATLGGGGLNACLLHLPVASTNPSLMLLGLSPADTLGTPTIRAINTRLGTSVSPGRLDQVLSSLLIAPPVNGWKPLLPTSVQYEIWLGGLFWRQPLISGGALPATDNFNRADENPLSNGGKWTTFSGTNFGNRIQVVSSQCTGTAGVDGGAFWNADTFNGDHYSQVLVIAMDANGCGPGVRGQGTASIYFFDLEGTDTNIIGKYVADLFTSLKTTNVTMAVNDTAKIDVSGSTIRIYQNGTQKDSSTDTALTGGASGLKASQTVGTFDNWQGDNVAAAAGSVVSPRRLALLGVGS